MHFELYGLAMNSHFGSVGSSAAALGSASAVNASSASATDANVRPPRLTPCLIVAPPLLALGWCCRHLRAPRNTSGAAFHIQRQETAVNKKPELIPRPGVSGKV